MLLDARTIVNGGEISTDVCIVGGGAAGLAIARELERGGRNVCVLEGGGTFCTPTGQALYAGSSTGTFLGPGNKYLSESRARCLGGTTSWWTGWCRPLDPIDFEERAWVAHSGWPFDAAHLAPYYRRAAREVEIDPFEFPERARPDRGRLLAGSALVETKLFHHSPPTRFGTAYLEGLRASKQVSVYLHANVVEIETNASATAVAGVAVATLNGARFSVRGRVFVLACGGVENARLLLASDRVQRSGLGNGHDLVGRFFADHPHLTSGQIVLAEAVAPPDMYAEPSAVKRSRVQVQRAHAVLVLTEQALRKERLQNVRFGLLKLEPEKVDELASAVGRSASRIASGASGRGPGGGRHYALDTSSEVQPNPASRVTLSRERDRLGRCRPQLDWRVTQVDHDNLRRALEILAREVGRGLYGRARILIDAEQPWPHAAGGHHHMGTTRMHADPRHGVVDADARVHGVQNLFIAGSSVFPTFGFANPTLTIIALALRLADHLRMFST